MLSTPKLPSTEVEAEEDKVEGEESEGLQLQRIEPVMNTWIIQNILTTLRVRGGEARHGPISPIFSVTTARSMDTMNENVERSKLTRLVTRTIAGPMSLKKKKVHQR